jgi:hypothetical protein
MRPIGKPYICLLSGCDPVLHQTDSHVGDAEPTAARLSLPPDAQLKGSPGPQADPHPTAPLVVEGAGSASGFFVIDFAELLELNRFVVGQPCVLKACRHGIMVALGVLTPRPCRKVGEKSTNERTGLA